MKYPGFMIGRWRMVFVLIAIFALSAVLSVTVSAQDTASQYTVGVQQIAEGLTSPVMFVPANDGSGRIFIVDQIGQIRIISSDGQLMPDPFLDVSDQLVQIRDGYDERGLLGLAFPSDYVNSGLFYVYYAAPLRSDAPSDWDHTNVVAEYHVSADDPNKADPSTQRLVFQIDHPSFNHNSGHITFGPDGYLYIPMGDGGGGNDAGLGHTPDLGNAQDTSNLHGAILRIDVNADGSGNAYTIPSDNPFVGNDAVANEIYAYGFRNPYAIAFSQDGQLFAADAGQNHYEEVDIVQAGGNYGWHIKEATHCFDADNPDTPPDTCADTGAMGEPLIDPVIEYTHDIGSVIVGANIYNGSAIPDLVGHLIFADYMATDATLSGVLLQAQPADTGLWNWSEIQVAGMDNNRIDQYILALGQDNDGEFYVLTTENSGPSGNTGKVWKIVPADAMAEMTPDASG